MQDPRRVNAQKLIDIHALQAATFLCDSSLLFEPESLDILNKCTQSYLESILAKAEQFVDPQTRILDEEAMKKTLLLLNIESEIQ